MQAIEPPVAAGIDRSTLSSRARDTDAAVAADRRHFSAEEVTGELQRIIFSTDFPASPRNRKFLKFVVERTLADPGREISAYDVATQVFGRPDTFNPSKDPIVRIEASKLRRDLQTYYLKSGGAHGMRIEIPLGGYRATCCEVNHDAHAMTKADGIPLSDDPLDELRRILSSADFPATARNRRFLEFVVTESLAGRAGDISAYTVATRVIGRPPDFDAACDPIVRIEARRLRRDLETYYLMSGCHNPVRITIPVGGYRPEFSKV